MAYDKIIVIHSRLDRCLDYVQNDGKTDLGNAVDYICDPVKAGFQTAINCTLDKSYLQMQETKRRWDKYGGILGYLDNAAKEEAQNVAITTQEQVDRAKASALSVAEKPPKYAKVVCEHCGHVMFIKEGDAVFSVEQS